MTEIWDKNEKQFSLISKFFVLKYSELIQETQEKFVKIKSKIDSSSVVEKELLEEVSTEIKKTQDLLKELEGSVLQHITKEENEKWKKSMTCPACFYSFLKYDDILEHLRVVHLIKMGMPDFHKSDD